MSYIQIILVIGFFASLLLYLNRFRSVLTDRLIAVGLFALASLTILFPGISVKVAQFLGVGRGTDLVLYVLAVTFLYAIVLLYTKIAALSEQQTRLARHIAISGAVEPGESTGGNAAGPEPVEGSSRSA